MVSSDWDQKDDFLAALTGALRDAPARVSWYPASAARVAAAGDEHADWVAPGGAPDRTLLTGLDLADADEPAFQAECFAPGLGVAELPGTGPDSLRGCVTAANERLRGTLRSRRSHRGSSTIGTPTSPGVA